MTRTIIYTRHARGDHRRLDADVQGMQAVLAEHGFEHEQAVVIRDTGTGRAANRAGFQELMSMLDSGTVGVLATPDLSRLAREAGALHHLYRALGHDVTVITCGGPLSDTVWPIVLMTGAMTAAWGAEHRRRIDGAGGSTM